MRMTGAPLKNVYRLLPAYRTFLLSDYNGFRLKDRRNDTMDGRLLILFEFKVSVLCSNRPKAGGRAGFRNVPRCVIPARTASRHSGNL
jgi:hypothetical protein